ncbi:MAG: ABC transporter permease [Neisseriaceae bacterium]
MDISFITQHISSFLSGTLITIELMLFALALGLILAVIFTICSYIKLKIVKFLIYIYTFVIRGTPLLVQIFIIYYGSSQFDFIRDSFMWNILKSPFGCAVIALAINSSGYCTTLFRGLINSIPKGEFEACKVLGMSKLQMISKIIAGRLLRIALPAYSNEVIIILKSTSLASTITIMDLMGVTHELISETYKTLPYLLVAGICYLLINMVIIKIFRILEKSVAIPH